MAQRWPEADASVATALEIAEPCHMLNMQWRLLALQARIQRESGNNDRSVELLAKAERVWRQAADTIADQGHRGHYTELAERYGI